MATRSLTAWIAAGAVVLSSACGSSVTVEVTTEGADGPQPQANLPVRFLPFDRDSVFDALDSQAATPPPVMSDDLQSAAQRVSELQAAWREKETEWSSTREELRELSQALEQIDSRHPDYRRQFERFGQLEGVERRLDRERKAAFDSFTAAQAQVTARVDSFRVVRETWADEAYAGYYDIEQELLDGAEVVEDTTGADGLVTVSLPGSGWWVTAVAPVEAGEIYWNLQLPDADTVRLNEGNGELRARF